jgi:hypothetical protein
VRRRLRDPCGAPDHSGHMLDALREIARAEKDQASALKDIASRCAK